MKKLICIVFLGFTLSGCKSDLESLLGKESGDQQDEFTFCSGRDSMVESARSLGGRGCGKPDLRLIQAFGPGDSGEMWINVAKMSDGKFPKVGISYDGGYEDGLDSLLFECVPANVMGSDAVGVQALVCRPKTDRRLSLFELASSDRRLRLDSIRFETDCGSSVNYHLRGPSNYSNCGFRPGNDLGGVEVNNYIAPDLYLETEF